MSTYLDDLGRARKPSLFARRFGLRPGEKAPAVQKGRRRRAFGVRQVLVLLALQAVFFVALRGAWLFLVTWDELAIRKVTVVCAKPGLRQAIENYYAVPRLGNILLCDLEAVRMQVRRLAWVRDAGVQKVFPSGLRIIFQEDHTQPIISITSVIDRGAGIDASLGTPPALPDLKQALIGASS